MALSPNLTVMERAIEKAARSLVRDFNEVEKLQISIKGPGDFVSKADQRAESIIVESLMKDRPDWGILAEEGTEHKGSDGYRFIIDPLDGTFNFLHGLPHWAITVALEKDGELIAAMTYDPIRQETFRVEKNAGAFMNHTRLRVSGRKELSGSLMGTEYGYRSAEKDKVYYPLVHPLVNHSGFQTRDMGCAALSLAYMAAGRYDAVFVYNTKVWDVAAGILMIKEAGGMASDLLLKPVNHEKGEVLAANPPLFKKLVEVLGIAA